MDSKSESPGSEVFTEDIRGGLFRGELSFSKSSSLSIRSSFSEGALISLDKAHTKLLISEHITNR